MPLACQCMPQPNSQTQPESQTQSESETESESESETESESQVQPDSVSQIHPESLPSQTRIADSCDSDWPVNDDESFQSLPEAVRDFRDMFSRSLPPELEESFTEDFPSHVESGSVATVVHYMPVRNIESDFLYSDILTRLPSARSFQVTCRVSSADTYPGPDSGQIQV
jgi:hypothetical protein